MRFRVIFNSCTQWSISRSDSSRRLSAIFSVISFMKPRFSLVPVSLGVSFFFVNTLLQCLNPQWWSLVVIITSVAGIPYANKESFSITTVSAVPFLSLSLLNSLSSSWKFLSTLPPLILKFRLSWLHLTTFSPMFNTWPAKLILVRTAFSWNGSIIVRLLA